jgi:putative tryptophan/tyrosine transport system substrate-binding protein
MMAPDLVGKQLQVLTEIVPKLSRVALLSNPASPGSAPQLRVAETVAPTLGLRLQLLEARTPQEIDQAFVAIAKERAGRSWFWRSPSSRIRRNSSPISP